MHLLGVGPVVTQVRCTSSGSSGVMTGSVSRCQPSRHWAARRVLARSAQAGQTDGEGVPARDEHLFHLAGVQVGAAELDGADAAAVLGGQVADDIAGQRHGQPLRAGRAWGHAVSVSPGSAGSSVVSGSVACQVTE